MIVIPASASRSIPRLRTGGLRDRLRAAIVSYNGHPYDAAGCLGPGQFVTFGTRPTGQGSAKGQAITASAGGFTFRSDLLGSTTYTHMTWLRITGVDNPWGGIITLSDGTGSTNQWSVQRSSSTNDLLFYQGSSNYAIGNGVLDIADGEWHTLAVTSDNSSTISVYLDGYLWASGTSGSPTSVSNPRIVLFGERNALANFGADGQIAQHCVWHRVLSAAEISSLHYDRWLMFAAQEIPLDSVDAGPPPAFISSWARNRSGVIGAGRGL